METTLVEIDQVGVLSLGQSSSLNHTAQACFSKPGTRGRLEKTSGHGVEG
jgi:hypothetical protein